MDNLQCMTLHSTYSKHLAEYFHGPRQKSMAGRRRKKSIRCDFHFSFKKIYFSYDFKRLVRDNKHLSRCFSKSSAQVVLITKSYQVQKRDKRASYFFSYSFLFSLTFKIRLKSHRMASLDAILQVIAKH